MSEADYYRVLEVEPTASDEEIKSTYRRLIRLYHPDLNPDPDAKNKLIRVIDAYELLGNRKKRATYDKLTQMFGSAPVKRSARRLVASRVYQTWPQPTRGQSRKLLPSFLLIFAIVVVFVGGWRWTDSKIFIKERRVTPAVEGYLSAPEYVSYERDDRADDLEHEYLRYCADEYRRSPNDPASAPRLADAYLSAAERALRHRDPDQAEVLASAARRVLCGEYPAASAMPRTLHGSQTEVATVSTYATDDFSEIK